MHEIIRGMVSLAEEKGVEIRYGSEVEEIEVEKGLAKRVRLISGEKIEADIVIAGADYHHVDKHLLNPN
ncbi:FAD-dependent oxidoreductase, partial [Algoriphagus sp.]